MDGILPGSTSRRLLPALSAPLLWLLSCSPVCAEVVIEGVDDLLDENILAYLQLDDEACDAPSWRTRRLYSQAESEILAALEVMGYYNAAVEKSFVRGEACWQATFNVSPGEPVRLRQVRVEVDTGEAIDTVLEQAARDCALRPGDALLHSAYEDCKRRLSRRAEDRGYFSASFAERQIDVYPEEYAADISLRLVTGPRYVFGATTFDQSVLNPGLVTRFVELEPGQPYDAERVRKLQRDLATSRYFDQVNIDRQPRGEPYYDVPLSIRLTPGKIRQYSAGIGYATDLGPKLRFGVLNRRRNQDGHQTEFEADLSPVLSQVAATYRIPLDRPRADWFTIDTGYKVEDTEDIRSNLFSLGGQRIRKRSNDWVDTLFLDLRLEDFAAGFEGGGYSTLLTPGFSYSYSSEDYPRRPTAGHRSLLTTRGAVENVVSDTSFLQFYGSTKRVFGLWSGGRVLIRGEYGTTIVDQLNTLPTSLRFYAGGDVSVRGYDYKSLGPLDPQGSVVGGKHLLTGSIEFDQLVAADWSVAAFVDTGNAFDDYNDIGLNTGVGAGFRWYSPLGPIRFDVAVPLAKDAPDSFRIHITLGPDL